MTKSSSSKPVTVKYDKNDLQAMLKVLQPDFKRIIKEGVLEYGQLSARLLYEHLTPAEVTTLVNHTTKSRPPERALGHRVRTSDIQEEVPLQSYQALNDKELLTEALLARILAGVSTKHPTKASGKKIQKKHYFLQHQRYFSLWSKAMQKSR